MIIRTAQYHYRGPDRLDITVKSKDPLGSKFAPTWDMVRTCKTTNTTEATEGNYLRDYYKILEHAPFSKLKDLGEQITLVCYCPVGAFCHRIVLASVIESRGHGLFVEEVNLKPDVETVPGDLLSIEKGIIVQQVNCRGKMGAGLALSIRRKYPQVYDSYMKRFSDGTLTLGNMFIVGITESLFVANIPAQDRYGIDKRYTSYGSLRKGLHMLKEVHPTLVRHYGDYLPIYFPYRIGCSLGGGDWYLVGHIIKDIISEAVILRKN